jgi:hypothetical protein
MIDGGLMSKIGRNDPCPCGSGKKYKNCCLKRERAMKQAEIMEERARRGYRDRFWKRFGEASYREKISIFHGYLGGSSAAADAVFDMLSTLLEEARERQDYTGFAELVESLKTRQPEIYDKHASFYSWFLIENMALQGDFRSLPGALETFAQNPEDIDEFFRVIEILMYHSRTEHLIEVMRKAYPKVMRSQEIIPPGKDEFASLLGWFIIFESLENDADLDEFSRDVSEYWGVDKAYLEGLVERLRGGLSGNWRWGDFVKGHKKREEVEGKILDLTLEFMGWLRGRSMSHPRALLARTALVEYLLDEEHYSKVKKGGLLLLPLRAPLDQHLANYLNFLNNLPYRVASLMEALPGYYGYLLQRGLIDGEEFKREVEAMKPLRDDVLKYFGSSGMEKGIPPAIEGAWREFEAEVR